MRKLLPHVNRVPFEGVLVYLDEPSDRSPSGANGRRTIVLSTAVKKALPTLIGMAVDFKPDWGGHDKRSKFGVITHARIVGKKVKVRGHIYGHDFPEVIAHLKNPPMPMGMSYSAEEVFVGMEGTKIYRVTDLTFSGAAVLYAHKAAYRKTTFKLTETP